MTETEPTYEYIKGQGWVPSIQRVFAQGYRKYAGKIYHVTILDVRPKRGERMAYLQDTVDTIRWFEEWTIDGVEIPAGFGPCIEELRNGRKVLTRLVDE